MNVMLHDKPIAWAPPAPLWPDSDRVAMRRPAILRFATDDFMQEFQRILARDPEKLRAQIAVPETWRGIRKPARTPNPRLGQGGMLARLGVAARRGSSPRTPAPGPASLEPGLDFKLYQPAHQRFYLVASSLVCQQAGLPDRKIDAGKSETVSFVVRRWFPPTDVVSEPLPVFDAALWIEHAFVAQADGSYAWVKVADAGSAESRRAVVLEDEERLPLFPMSFAEDDGRTRRLLAGLVPVGKREAYHAAMRPRADGSPGGVTENTARIAHFRKLVSEPWKAIVEMARTASRRKQAATRPPILPDPDDQLPVPAAEDPSTVREVRGRIQLASWLVLADLLSFLQTYLPTVYAGLEQNVPSLEGRPGEVLAALDATLLGTQLKAALAEGVVLSPASLRVALRQFLTTATLASLENTTAAYAWPRSSTHYPNFLFPLADPVFPLEAARPAFGSIQTPVPDPPVEPPSSPPGGDNFDAVKLDIDRFAALVVRALETAPGQPEPAVPAAAEKPADLRDGWFQLRCVYERPNCGALHKDVVSAPSEPFKLAGFFDPDAPARPIRIGLPIDTTPAGLRKFDKNTAFMMSDILCGQVARFKGITLGDLVLSVLPWPFHKDLPSFSEEGPCRQGTTPMGTICSLSIPIITLCALILLIIMVAVLDFIFKWIPFLMVCFPLPGFRAKK